MPFHKIPIRFETKAGRVADMQKPVAQLGVGLEQPVGERVGIGSAMRLDPVGAARTRQHQMAVNFRRGMRRDDNAVRFGQRGDAQGLGKPGGPRRVELHVTDPASDDEIAHREAGQLALAMRQRDRRRRRETREIGRLQVPVQRFFEPEDALRFDAAAKSMQSGRS